MVVLVVVFVRVLVFSVFSVVDRIAAAPFRNFVDGVVTGKDTHLIFVTGRSLTKKLTNKKWSS